MIYSYNQWLEIILPYPSLSRSTAATAIINDVLITRVPGIIQSFLPYESSQRKVIFVEFLVYIASDNVLYLDDDMLNVNIFRSNIKNLDAESHEIIIKRLQRKYGED